MTPKWRATFQELELPSAGHVERFDAQEAIVCADRLMADYDVVLSPPPGQVPGPGPGGAEKRGAAAPAAGAFNQKKILMTDVRGPGVFSDTWSPLFFSARWGILQEQEKCFAKFEKKALDKMTGLGLQ